MSPCVCALLQQGSTSTAVRQQPGPQHHSGNRAAPCRAVSLRLTPQWLGRRSVASRAQCRTVQAAATAEMGKLIAKTEIPAFIPRQDLMDQLTRWAYTEIQEESMRKFGLAVKVQRTVHEGIPWGFVSSILRDGATVTDISVSFDLEKTQKYDWVGRNSEGFPQMEGEAEQILGKNFVIRKADDNPIDEEVRGVIRILCQEIQASINKYYAFGSCFVDDAT